VSEIYCKKCGWQDPYEEYYCSSCYSEIERSADELGCYEEECYFLGAEVEELREKIELLERYLMLALCLQRLL